MSNVLADALLLTTAGFFLGCDVGSGSGWSMVAAQALIAAALLALLLGDLGLVHGL